MIEFLSGASLWSRLEKTSASANKRTAAIAYLTLDNLRFSAGDMLIVDAGDSSIGSARTSAALLKKLHKRGVGLFSYDRLHAKVIVLDREIFASSANASKSSKENLFEAGIVTDSPSVRAQAVADIHNLSKVSIRIDQESSLGLKR